MATTSVMAFFNPAETAYYADDVGRQLDFTQFADGNVSVRVRYGLTEINQVYQDCIFAQRNSNRLGQSFAELHPVQKRSLIRSIVSDRVDVITVDGPITDVRKRNTVGDVFLHKIRRIILVMQ